jgi:hypothetical protein
MSNVFYLSKIVFYTYFSFFILSMLFLIIGIIPVANWLLIIYGLLGSIFTLYMILLIHNKKIYIKITDKTIEVAGPFNKLQIIKWEEISQFSHSIRKGIVSMTLHLHYGKDVIIIGYNDILLHKSILMNLSKKEGEVSSNEEKVIDNYINNLQSALLQSQFFHKIMLIIFSVIMVISLIVLFIALNYIK